MTRRPSRAAPGRTNDVTKDVPVLNDGAAVITTLKPLAIKPPKVKTPQCCVEVDPPSHATMWRRDRYKRLRPTFNADRCQRESVFEIDGKPYCRLHASGIALERWLNGELKVGVDR